MFSALMLTALLQSVTPSGWIFDDETSALDGRRTVMAGRESDTTVINVSGQPEKAMLTVACAGSQRKVAILWPAFLGRDEVYVDWKVGDGEIKRTTFYLADGRTGQVSGRAAQTLFDAVRTEQPMVVRVHAYRGAAETTFTLAGAGEFVDEAEAACPARRRS